MTYSALWDGTTGSPTDLGKQRVSLELAKAGYRGGQDPVLPPVVATPNTLPDLRDALRNAPTPGTVVFPEGDIPFDEVVDYCPDGRGLDEHPNGTTLVHAKSLFDLLGVGPYSTTTGSHGWEYGGGALWFKARTEIVGRSIGHRFPGDALPAHHFEKGYNPLAFENCTDCAWLRPRATDADAFVFLDGTRLTLVDPDFTSPKRGRGTTSAPVAHYGVMQQGGTYTLVKGGRVDLTCRHDNSVGHKSGVNVNTRTAYYDPCLDHHKDAFPAHDALYDLLNVGKKSRLYLNGGPSNAGYRWYDKGDVIWGCYGMLNGVKQPLGFIPAEWTGLSIVGNKPLSAPPTASQYQEVVPLDQLEPVSLYDALLAYAAGPSPAPTPTIEEVVRAWFVSKGMTEAMADYTMVGLKP